MIATISTPKVHCHDCGALGAKPKYPNMPVTMCPPRCPVCQEISDIVSTSVEEAVKYQIPKASEAALIAVLKASSKITLRKAAARQLTKLNQAKRGAK